MPTNVFTKNAFIAMIEKEMGESQLVVATSVVNGTISISKKQLKIPFAFDANAFKDQGVGHIAFGETWCISACILEPKRVSDLGHSVLIKSPKEKAKRSKQIKS
jgi:hypothetical protein